MNRKQLCALMLALSLIVTLFSGNVLSTSAGYESEIAAQASSDYVANWGVRGDECTELSSYAEAFYTGIYVYEDMSQTRGGTSQSNAYQSALYAELKELMTSRHEHTTSYDETKDLYKYTDCENGNTAYISAFYSGIQLSGSWNQSWNREHTWPKSKETTGAAKNDIMMLRPTSVSENSSRGNTAYGESSGYYDPNEESNGKHNLRGDCARIVLYVYTRWGNTSYMWGSDGVMESLTVLLDWMEEDPVDTWEMGRNDAVQSITGTRNVFVDYPEYAWLLFGEEVPAGYATPSNGEGGTSTPGGSTGGSSSSTPEETTPPTTNEYTIPEVIAAADGTEVVVTGTVKFINEAWNSYYKNITVTVVDDEGNELYIYRMKTDVAIGDTITVTGKVGSYNGAKQIAQGSTAEIVGHKDIVVTYDPVTVAEALTSDDGRLVTFTGTVTEVRYTWSDNNNNMSVSITDAEGDTIYAYKLGAKVELGDIITVKGVIGSHDGEKQIAQGATAEIIDHDDSVTAPETTEPETTEPETTEPETTEPETTEPDIELSGSQLAEFEFGANAAPGHKDGSEVGDDTSTFYCGSYSFKIENASKVYVKAFDAMGNSAIKLGTGSKVGSFSFTVGGDVQSVIINIAGYKKNTAKVNINGTEYNITSSSDNGQYTQIIIDTSVVKTVEITTLTGGYRAMINSVIYCGAVVDIPDVPETTEPETTEPETTEPETTEPETSEPETTEPETTEPETTEPETSEPETSEPETTEPETTEPETTEPETTEPAEAEDKVTYNFKDYAAGEQYAKDEVHVLDGILTVITNDGHFTDQIRLYQSSTHSATAVFSSTKIIESMTVNAGYKADILKVWGSADGENWTIIDEIAVSENYASYDVDAAGMGYTYIKLEATAAQIRVASVTMSYSDVEVAPPEVTDPETTEPETTEPETTEPETTEPETTEPETSEPETSEPETSEPETTEPETTEPETTEPETTEPETTEPEPTEPEPTEPEPTEPETTEPETTEPETTEPETTEPEKPTTPPDSKPTDKPNNTDKNKGGCGSFVSGGIAVMIAVSIAGTFLLGKKEDQ